MPKRRSSKKEFKKIIREIKETDTLEVERSKKYYRLGKYLKKEYTTTALSNYVLRAARRIYKYFKGSEITSVLIL